MTAFKEILINGYVLRFWPSDNGWMCGITESMMDALAQQVVAPEREIVQVSPLEFVEMVMEKEHLVGKPIFWAEWPNREDSK